MYSGSPYANFQGKRWDNTEQACHKVEVLDKVKKLAMLPDDLHVTTEMAANYYETSDETIKSVVKDHREELLSDGMRILTKGELKSFKDLTSAGKRAKHLMILPRHAVLRLGMLVRDSEVAKQIRTYLLNVEEVARLEAPEVIDSRDHKETVNILLTVFKALTDKLAAPP